MYVVYDVLCLVVYFSICTIFLKQGEQKTEHGDMVVNYMLNDYVNKDIIEEEMTITIATIYRR